MLSKTQTRAEIAIPGVETIRGEAAGVEEVDPAVVVAAAEEEVVAVAVVADRTRKLYCLLWKLITTCQTIGGKK